MGVLYDAMRESFAILTDSELEQVRSAVEDEIRSRDTDENEMDLASMFARSMRASVH